MTRVVHCSCGYKFSKAELEDIETCPKCEKMFCPYCGDSVTPASGSRYGYNGPVFLCGNCKELLG